MEDSLGVVVVIFAIFVVSVLLTLGQRRKLNDAWSATVEKVEQFEHHPKGCSSREIVHVMWMRLHYRRDDGLTGQIENSVASFLVGGVSDVKPGDRLIKEPGQYVPRIVKR